MFCRWLSYKEVLACSELQILLLFLSSFASSCFFFVIKKCLEFWSHWSWGVSPSRSSTPRQTSPEVKPLKVAIGCQHWCIDPWWNSSMPNDMLICSIYMYFQGSLPLHFATFAFLHNFVECHCDENQLCRLKQRRLGVFCWGLAHEPSEVDLWC